MNKKITDLLNETGGTIAKALTELEARNGYPSHDVRFYANTRQKIQHKLKELGLDANDTTGEELFHALQVKFKIDAANFEKKYGELLNFDEKATKAVEITNRNHTMPQLWALKSPYARIILKTHPPKQMMKQLGYRSVDSMLKRENIAKIFLIAKNTESANWHNMLYRTISKLDQSALELRQIKVITLPRTELSEIESDDLTVFADEVAALGLWPSGINSKASLLSMVLTLGESLSSISYQHNFRLDTLDDSVNWWADMDYLLADFSGDKISLNIHDVAESQLHCHKYNERVISRSKHHYWNKLLEQYENRPQTETLFNNSVIQKLRRLKIKAPEPAYEFEYAEEI